MAKRIPGYESKFSERRKKGHRTGEGYEGVAEERIKKHAERIGLASSKKGGLKSARAGVKHRAGRRFHRRRRSSDKA